MAQGDEQIRGVQVEIFGDRYSIGGDPRQVQQVAAYVDAKMKEIAGQQGPRRSKAEVAILAAMEVTAELFKVMSERKAFTDRAHESIERLTRLVEDRARLTGVSDATLPSASRLRERLAVRMPDTTPVE